MINTVRTDIVQGTDGWFSEKMGLISSSNFSDIMAQGRYGKEAASRRNYRARIILERITGHTPSRFLFRETEEIKWGKETEALARLEYELRTGNTIAEIGGVRHAFLPVWSSTDGVDDPEAIRRVLEIKCFNSANHLEMLHTGKVSSDYYAEVMGELWLTEAEVCDFVSFDPDFPPESQILIIPVQRDEKYINDLAVEVSKFNDEVEAEVEFIRNYGVSQ